MSLEEVDKLVGVGSHNAFADTAAARSITLVRDTERLLPMDALSMVPTLHIRYAGSTRLWANRAFGSGLRERVFDLTEVSLDERSDSDAYTDALEALERVDRVIVTTYVSASAGSSASALPEPPETLLPRLEARPTVMISFGNPYLLAAVQEVGSYMLAWGDRDRSQRAAIAALFGEEAITGRLPIPLPPFNEVGDGLDRPKVSDRLATMEIEDPVVAAGIIAARGGGPRGSNQSVADPESVGVSSESLMVVDSLILAGIADSAFSGAAAAIGRHGRLVSPTRLESFSMELGVR